jgi:hypothetical protein
MVRIEISVVQEVCYEGSYRNKYGLGNMPIILVRIWAVMVQFIHIGINLVQELW